MAENGGPIFEGSSARPEKKRPRIVERVKQRIDAFRVGLQKEVDVRKGFGREIQARTMDRYTKIVGGMNESMLKTAYKKLEPVVKLKATVSGVVAGVADISVKSVVRGTELALSVATGFAARDALDAKVGKGKAILKMLGFGAATVAADVAYQKTPDIRPIHMARRKIEDARDYVGLKSVDILNKIIGRKPEAMPA